MCRFLLFAVEHSNFRYMQLACIILISAFYKFFLAKSRRKQLLLRVLYSPFRIRVKHHLNVCSNIVITLPLLKQQHEHNTNLHWRTRISTFVWCKNRKYLAKTKQPTTATLTVRSTFQINLSALNTFNFATKKLVSVTHDPDTLLKWRPIGHCRLQKLQNNSTLESTVLLYQQTGILEHRRLCIRLEQVTYILWMIYIV